MSKWEQYEIAEKATPLLAKASKWEAYEIPEQNTLQTESDSLPAMIGKSYAKGITNLAGMFGNFQTKPQASPEAQKIIDKARSRLSPQEVRMLDDRMPNSEEVQNYITDKTGINFDTNPQTDVERILSHGAEFAGSMGPFGLAAKGGVGVKALNAAKQSGIGAGLGLTSGTLQEAGVDPLVADLTVSAGLPYAGAKSKNLLSSFTKKAKNKAAKKEVARILKQDIGEDKLPEVLERLDYKSPIGVKPTTAELSENVGLAHRYRAESPNMANLAEREALNDSIIRSELEKLTPHKGLSDEVVGTAVRDNLSERLANAKQVRSDQTAPLYKNVENLTDKITLPQTTEYLKEAGRYAEGDIKNNIKYINDTLGKQAEMLPVQAINKRKAITDRLSDVKGSDSRRILKDVEQSMLDDMAHIPEEQVARQAYHKLSEPVSAIEQQPLLGKFVKKDKYKKDYELSPETIPNKILSSNLKDVKALKKQLDSNPDTLNMVRSNIVDKLLTSSENASINALGEQKLSYNKVNNLLRKQKPKLEVLFEKEQVELLEHIRELLKKRNRVSSVGRAVGSNTQSEQTLLQMLSEPPKASLMSFVEGTPFIGRPIQQIRDRSRAMTDKRVKSILGQALENPQVAKDILTMPKDKTAWRSFVDRSSNPFAASIINNSE